MGPRWRGGYAEEINNVAAVVVVVVGVFVRPPSLPLLLCAWLVCRFLFGFSPFSTTTAGTLALVCVKRQSDRRLFATTSRLAFVRLVAAPPSLASPASLVCSLPFAE